MELVADMETRIASLERNIHSLQQMHKETLSQLHGEIDRLKRQNKELQFKLIMEQQVSCGKGSVNNEQKYSTEDKTLQSARGIYLEHTVEDACLLSPDTNLGDYSKSYGAEVSRTSERSAAAGTESVPEAKVGLITSLVPLRIQRSSSQPPRVPTLQECEVIIRQLYNANSLQSQEILRLKDVLRDIVINKKITPENYILTKAYLADGKRVEEPVRFPKLSFCTVPKGSPVCQASLPERVILPALTQSLSTSYAERQRRTRAVQRSRFRRAVT